MTIPQGIARAIGAGAVAQRRTLSRAISTDILDFRARVLVIQAARGPLTGSDSALDTGLLA
jgi:hypothetical protein